MIVDRIARALGQGQRFTLKDYEQAMGTVWGQGGANYAGESVTVDRALGLIPVFAAVQVIASSISVMPCHVYRRLDRGRDRASDTWQYRLLHDAPNPEMAPGQFFETLLAHMLLWGNAYLEKVPVTIAGIEQVAELWPIQPNRVNVDRRKTDQEKVFEVDGEPRSFTQQTILHIPALGYDGTRGLSPIGVARQQLGVDLARQKYVGGIYRRGPGLGGVIERPFTAPQWGKDAKASFKEQWSGLYEGGDRAGGTPVLEDGMTFHQVGMPLKDQQFVEQERLTTTQIATLYNMPASRINGATGDSLTYGNREQDALEFVTFTCLPWMNRVSQGLWRDPVMFPSRRFYPGFLPEALLQGDAKSRAEVYDLMMNRLHVLTPNDIAEKEDLPQRPDGDEIPKPAAPVAPPAGGDDGPTD